MYGGYPYGAPPPPPPGGPGGKGYGGARPMGLPRGVPMPYGAPGGYAAAPPPMYASPEPLMFDGRMSADAIEEEIRMRQERIRLLDMKVKEREIMDLERKEHELRQQAADRRGAQRQPQAWDRSRSPRGPVNAGGGHQQWRPRHVTAKPPAPQGSPRSSPTPETYFKPVRSGAGPAAPPPVAPRAGAALGRAAAAHHQQDAMDDGHAEFHGRRARAAERAASRMEAPGRGLALQSAPGRGADAPFQPFKPFRNLVLAPRSSGDRQAPAPPAQGRGPLQSKLLLEPAAHAQSAPVLVRSKSPNAQGQFGHMKRGVYAFKQELTIDYSGSDLSTIEKATEAHDAMVRIFESMGMMPEGQSEHWASLLDLSRCKLGDEALEMFLQTLVSYKVRPRVLKLFRNQIGNAGMDSLSEFVLHTPAAIEEFHLSHNKISEDGVTDVLSTMQKHEAYTTMSRPAWFRVEKNEIKDPRELLRFLREDLGVEYRLSEKPSWKQGENDCTLVTLFPI